MQGALTGKGSLTLAPTSVHTLLTLTGNFMFN